MNEKNVDDYNEILSKLLKTKVDGLKAIKIIFTIACSIIFVMTAGCILFMAYTNKTSVESIISALLAFFSIFIAIFFYFKADETSSKFYNSSYNFMKDISVTLGKIEERFGEKLNSVNEKLAHIENDKMDTEEKIVSNEEEKDKVINELLEKTKLKEDEKEMYKNRLLMMERQANFLRNRLMHLEQDSEVIKTRKDILEGMPTDIARDILDGNTKNLSKYIISRLIREGIIDDNQLLTPIGKNKLTNKINGLL